MFNFFKDKNPASFIGEEKNKKFLKVNLWVGLAGLILILAVVILIMHSLISFSYSVFQSARGRDWSFTFSPWKKMEQLEANLRKEIEDNLKKSGELPIKVVDEQSQVIDVVKKNSPAVVSVIASAEVPKYEQCYDQAPNLGLPPGFEDFFNLNMPSWCQNGTEKKRVGAGTGFIVSSDGYIVTNKHVVSDEKAEYTVVLNNENNLGEKVVAKVLARDPDNDIAVLKIEKTDLPYIDFGDSDKLQVGQTVIAIGYAMGEFENTVSKGVISGLARSIVAGSPMSGDAENLNNLIQTDAAINPGNSGGPLLDIGGNAIGINTAVSDGQNIGFAIPVNLVKNAFEAVKKNGKIEKAAKPYLGVRFIAVNEQVKEKNNLPYDYGALIARGESRDELAVLPGSPADKAGLVENDIILEVDGKQLNERYLLSDAVAKRSPGDELKLKVYHKGEVKEIKVKLEKK